MGAGRTVWVVDDDSQMRESVVYLLESAGHHVKAFATPTELLEDYDPDCPGCLLLDLHMPEMNGLELWETLHRRGSRHPFIMMSGHGEVSMAVESMHQGAVDFIEKPFHYARLLACVDLALKRDAAARRRQLEEARLNALLDSLTPREREVMQMVAEGMLTKQIAKRLGISEKTVEVHRSHVTRKMRVRSVAQLVRLLTRHSPLLRESAPSEEQQPPKPEDE